jgi:hypothetical protein
LFKGISRRGDFEVLLFNIIDWLGGHLPWDEEPQLKPKVIERMKIKAFDDIPEFLLTTFNTSAYPGTTDVMWIAFKADYLSL